MDRQLESQFVPHCRYPNLTGVNQDLAVIARREANAILHPPGRTLVTVAAEMECIRMHFGAKRPCDEYNGTREMCAPCFIRTEVKRLHG